MKPALVAVSTRFVLAVVCLLCALAAVSAADGGPAEQLTGAINRILEVLEDPALKGEVRAATAIGPSDRSRMRSSTSRRRHDYRMLNRGDRWRIYDVSIEGVSLVANYRTQFNSIIRTSSYDELIRKMRSRVEEIRQ
jgi:hypothetical protein